LGRDESATTGDVGAAARTGGGGAFISRGS
jgi:hypothetical protein